MASNSQATSNKRAWRLAKAGRQRKNQEARRSTPSYAELFAACGEPGQPVPPAGKPAPSKATPPKSPRT